jgi:hypothetical protein
MSRLETSKHCLPQPQSFDMAVKAIYVVHGSGGGRSSFRCLRRGIPLLLFDSIWLQFCAQTKEGCEASWFRRLLVVVAHIINTYLLALCLTEMSEARSKRRTAEKLSNCSCVNCDALPLESKKRLDHSSDKTEKCKCAGR